MQNTSNSFRNAIYFDFEYLGEGFIISDQNKPSETFILRQVPSSSVA